MSHLASAGIGLFALLGCLMAPPASHAQSGYYGRTRSVTGFAPVARDSTRDRAAELARGRASQRNAGLSNFDDANDPLQHYGSEGSGPETRKLGQETTSQQPPRPQPVRQIRRNYFPELRGGQSPNRNVPTPRHHCVPGRNQFLGTRR